MNQENPSPKNNESSSEIKKQIGLSARKAMSSVSNIKNKVSAKINGKKGGAGLKKKIFVLIGAAIIIFGIKSCLHKPKPVQTPPRPVDISKSIQKDIPILLESFGNLNPLNDVDIKSQVTGKVKEFNFEEGKEVSRGDLLFVIEPDEYEANLKKAQASLAQNTADLEFKKDTLQRNEILIKKDLISKQEFERYQTDVKTAQAQVHLDKATVELESINLGYCYIRAPVAGITGKRLVDPGNIISANTGPTLVNIKTLDPLYIDFTVPEKEISRLREAMAKQALKVEIKPEGDPNNTFEGKLQLISNSVDNLTGTLSLRATVDNAERKLWPGQFVKIRLILGTKKDAVLVPETAIRLGQKGYYLFAVGSDNKADLRQLTVGEEIDGYMEVEKGVKSGETVITSGQLGLKSGTPIIDAAKLEKEKAENSAQKNKKKK
ncbi:MAG: efflux RND transporter periplasmic adaptor subunit [Candidatus Omnitrophota bacterium]